MYFMDFHLPFFGMFCAICFVICKHLFKIKVFVLSLHVLTKFDKNSVCFVKMVHMCTCCLKTSNDCHTRPHLMHCIYPKNKYRVVIWHGLFDFNSNLFAKTKHRYFVWVLLHVSKSAFKFVSGCITVATGSLSNAQLYFVYVTMQSTMQ